LAQIRKALHSILAKRSQIVFAAVRPLLNDHLDQPFDPGRFDADNVGDFLRRYADELGVRVEQGTHDWELAIAGSKQSAQPVPRSDGGSPVVSQAASAPLYMRVLEREWPKFFLPPAAEWRRIVELVFDTFAAQSAHGTTGVTPGAVLEEVVEAAEHEGIEAAERKVKAVMFQCLHAEMLRDAQSAQIISDARPARWHQPVLLVAADAPALLRAIRQLIVRVVAARLGNRDGAPVLEAEALAELLDGPEPTSEQVDAARAAMATSG
jgi:hypothetical protein